MGVAIQPEIAGRPAVPEFVAPADGTARFNVRLTGANGHWHIHLVCNDEAKAYVMLLAPQYRRSDYEEKIARTEGEGHCEVRKGDRIKIRAGANAADDWESQVVFDARFVFAAGHSPIRITPMDADKTFVTAAAKSDDALPVVRELWESKQINNIDVPIAVPGGNAGPWPALLWASNNGHLQIVRYLISQGMRPSTDVR